MTRSIARQRSSSVILNSTSAFIALGETLSKLFILKLAVAELIIFLKIQFKF